MGDDPNDEVLLLDTQDFDAQDNLLLDSGDDLLLASFGFVDPGAGVAGIKGTPDLRVRLVSSGALWHIAEAGSGYTPDLRVEIVTENPDRDAVLITERGRADRLVEIVT